MTSTEKGQRHQSYGPSENKETDAQSSHSSQSSQSKGKGPEIPLPQYFTHETLWPVFPIEKDEVHLTPKNLI